MNKMIKFIKEPWRIVVAFDRHIASIVPDKLFLKCLFRINFDKKLNLKSPKTYSEKLQWLKLYNRKDEYSKMVDKAEVKKLVAQIIGDEHITPTYGVWKRFEDIDITSLPNQFVLKCTHDSGSVFVCKDKSKIDKELLKKQFNRNLKKNYYYRFREWPYKNVERQIMAEKLLSSGDDERLVVYKFFCFSGEPKIIQVIQDDKMENETIDYFSINWELLDIWQGKPNSKLHLKRPEQLAEMVKFARALSQGFPTIRVDFYLSEGKIYFSEYTFFPDAGTTAFHPSKWDKVLGEWTDLSII